MAEAPDPSDTTTRPEARLGLALQHVRKERGLSLRAVATRLHRAHSNLHDYEKGHRLAPIEVVEGYEAILDVAPGSLTSLHRRATDDRESENGLQPSHRDPEQRSADVRSFERQDSAPAPGRRPRAVVLLSLTALVATVAIAVAVFVISRGENGAPAFVAVYNIEAGCQMPRTDNCRLGLARDPYASYTPENVIGYVWHGDKLPVECFIPDGAQIVAEDGTMTKRWYRVSLPPETPAAPPGAKAWLPSIRVRRGTEPAVSRCKPGV